jgi:tetratricopeptide (TPR) repeat protein
MQSISRLKPEVFMHSHERGYIQISKTRAKTQIVFAICYFAILVPLFPALFGCSTTADNIVMTGEEARILEACKEADLMLLDFRFTKDASTADEANALIKAQLSKKIIDKALLARLYGLAGILELELGKKEGVRKYIDLIENLSNGEERLYILKAALETPDAKKIEILEAGSRKCEKNARITLELAGLYATRGDYMKAGAAYDEAFVALDPKYTELYKKSRDTAFRLITAGGNFESVAQILMKDELTVGEMLVATVKSTHFLSNAGIDKAGNQKALFDICAQNGYLPPAIGSPDDPLAKKDAAYFFLAILMYQENSKTLATKYSSVYSRTNKQSPVPDIKVTDYYFDAVLILVEREILDLPDGIHFYPDKTLGGDELSVILKKLLKLYNY